MLMDSEGKVRPEPPLDRDTVVFQFSLSELIILSHALESLLQGWNNYGDAPENVNDVIRFHEEIEDRWRYKGSNMQGVKTENITIKCPISPKDYPMAVLAVEKYRGSSFEQDYLSNVRRQFDQAPLVYAVLEASDAPTFWVTR